MALGGPSGQAENPSPLSRRRHWPLPLVGRYLGHNPQPPAPPKGDWPEEADLARLTPCLTNPRSLDLTTGDTKMWGQCRSLGSDYKAWR